MGENNTILGWEERDLLLTFFVISTWVFIGMFVVLSGIMYFGLIYIFVSAFIVWSVVAEFFEKISRWIR